MTYDSQIGMLQPSYGAGLEPWIGWAENQCIALCARDQ